MNGLKLFTIRAAPLTVLTAIFAFLSLYFLNENINQNIVQVIFIGLASLTLPHIILEVLDRRNG
jgi:preprotein translocase subunit SecF